MFFVTLIIKLINMILSTCAENEQVQKEGVIKVKRNIKYYNLDMIISIGYRVI